MRNGIVEGEPGSMPWGQWWLMRWVRDKLTGRHHDEAPPTSPPPPPPAPPPPES